MTQASIQTEYLKGRTLRHTQILLEYVAEYGNMENYKKIEQAIKLINEVNV